MRHLWPSTKTRGANSKIDENVSERQEQLSKAVAWRHSEKKTWSEYLEIICPCAYIS